MPRHPPVPADWTSTGVPPSSDALAATTRGGRFGFKPVGGAWLHVDDVTIKVHRDTTGNGTPDTWVTEHIEDFTVDNDGYADEELTHDDAGNMTYDGVFAYTYDAWNRLVQVTKAYRSPSGTGNLSYGSVVNEVRYDGLGRRIVKAVKNSADLDCTYHYYYNPGGQSIIETRNGSNQTLKQHVWGSPGSYIDELVQTSLNDDPADSGEQDCESHYWVMQDANFNILGVVDSSGTLRERYEYTPYGERRVFTSPGVNDPLCYAPIDISKRWVVSSTAQPYGLCEVGHQGLWHDEELGPDAIDNRNRYRKGERFLQRDPLEYEDGMNSYQHGLSNPVTITDPSGEISQGAHHGYPLHLGGSNSQPLIPLSAYQHRRAHAYLRTRGFGFGAGGRANWSALKPAEQRFHIRASLRFAGVSSNWIRQNIDSVMEGANPGVKTPRVPAGAKSAGFTTPGAMKSLAGGTVVMAVATAGYNYYLSAANNLGQMASNATLCKELQDFDRDATLSFELRVDQNNRHFYYIASDGVTYAVNIINYQGCCYFSASYVRHRVLRGGFFWTSKYHADETVEPIHPKHAFKCPANARKVDNSGQTCNRI